MSLISTLVLTLSLFASVAQAADLQFFGGDVTATLTWVKAPSMAKAAQLKIELKEGSRVYNLDASQVAVGIMMPSMPDMGTDEQSVENMNDVSGNPVAGSYIIADMKFSMPGGWAVQLTLPNPKDQKKTETKSLKFNVK